MHLSSHPTQRHNPTWIDLSAPLDPAQYIIFLCCSRVLFPQLPPRKANHVGYVHFPLACGLGSEYGRHQQRRRTLKQEYLLPQFSPFGVFRLMPSLQKRPQLWVTGGPFHITTLSGFCKYSLPLPFSMDFLCVSFQVLSYPLLVPQIPTTPLEMSLIIKHPPNYKL